MILCLFLYSQNMVSVEQWTIFEIGPITTFYSIVLFPLYYVLRSDSHNNFGAGSIHPVQQPLHVFGLRHPSINNIYVLRVYW